MKPLALLSASIRPLSSLFFARTVSPTRIPAAFRSLIANSDVFVPNLEGPISVSPPYHEIRLLSNPLLDSAFARC